MTEIMVDRVAEAIYRQEHPRGCWASATCKPPYVAMAKAAIKAMRTPTEAMDQAGRGCNYNLYATAAWEAMIDTAMRQG